MSDHITLTASEYGAMESDATELAAELTRLRAREAVLVEALIGARNVLSSVDFRDGTIAGRRMAIISRIGKINDVLATISEEQ